MIRYPVTNNLSSYEKLDDELLLYDSTKIFSFTYFIFLPLHERTKLEPRARLYCFIGYGSGQKRYRYWDPISQ